MLFQALSRCCDDWRCELHRFFDLLDGGAAALFVVSLLTSPSAVENRTLETVRLRIDGSGDCGARALTDVTVVLEDDTGSQI